jgi:hypothetical protein
MTTETQTPDDWVLLEAAKRSDTWCRSIEWLRNLYNASESFRALCDMIQKYEAFKQEVSDAAQLITNTKVDPTLWRKWVEDILSKYIIPKPKPDPLVEVLADLNWLSATNKFRTALEARGLEIRKKKP